MEIIKYTEIEPAAAAIALFSIAWKDYIDTDMLKNSYPGFEKWLLENTFKRLGYDKDILFVLDEIRDTVRLVGFAIIKKSAENKICTFQIFKEYRHRGYAKALIKKCIECLKKDIIISVSEHLLTEFDHILTSNHFQMYSRKRIYTDEMEYFFIRKGGS